MLQNSVVGRKYTDEQAREIMLAAGVKPIVNYESSSTPWKSICLKCKQEINPSLNSVQQRKGPCKYCSKKRVIENIQLNNTEEATKLVRSLGLEPLEEFQGVKKPWKCKCTLCENIISPRIGNIRSGQGACGFCSGVIINPNTAYKDMLKMDLQPLVDFPGSKKKWKSKCLKCGNIVFPYYTAIQQGRKACVYCGGNRVTLDKVMEIMAAAGYEPLEPYSKATTKWKSKCLQCGKISYPMYNSVQQGNRCGFCAGIRVDSSEAIELMKSRELTPQEDYPGADAHWKCKCEKCQNLVYTTYSLVKNGSGCRYCALTGFRFNEPAMLYLITNRELQAHKIGITNLKDKKVNSRMMKHSAQGWETFKILELPNGEAAMKLETEILRWLRFELGMKQFLSPELMPQGGATETVDASEIDLSTIWAKVLEASSLYL